MGAYEPTGDGVPKGDGWVYAGGQSGPGQGSSIFCGTSWPDSAR